MAFFELLYIKVYVRIVYLYNLLRDKEYLEKKRRRKSSSEVENK